MINKTTWIFTKRFNVEVLDESEKAYLVLVHQAPDWLEGRQTWMPKSAFQESGKSTECNNNIIIEAVVPNWFWVMLNDDYRCKGVV